jgi:Protein of unknown function (DUF2690)
MERSIMSYTSVLSQMGFVLALTVSAPLFAGCAVPAQDPGEEPSEAVGAAEEELISCFDASCTGLDPSLTYCMNSGVAVSSQPITDQYGAPLGTVTLFYSQTCHTVWGSAGFSASHGGFQLCATDITNVSQPPQCTNYAAGKSGVPSKMQFLRVNDSGYSSVFVSSPTLGSGGTAAYKRTF